jgi:hypothetical protein
MKENREGKRRIRQLVREANLERENILNEQIEFQEVMGLYG